MTQATVREIGLGDQHEARGVTIEPVYDPRPALESATQRGAAGNQRIHQRVVPMAGSRMHDEPGRLIDYREVLVFPDDREWDVRGSKLSRRLRRGNGDGYPITAREEPRGASYDAA